MAIAAGIGLFLALIALKNAGIVVGDQATLVTHGKLTSFPVVMAALGFALIVAAANIAASWAESSSGSWP